MYAFFFHTYPQTHTNTHTHTHTHAHTHTDKHTQPISLLPQFTDWLLQHLGRESSHQHSCLFLHCQTGDRAILKLTKVLSSSPLYLINLLCSSLLMPLLFSLSKVCPRGALSLCLNATSFEKLFLFQSLLFSLLLPFITMSLSSTEKIVLSCYSTTVPFGNGFWPFCCEGHSLQSEIAAGWIYCMNVFSYRLTSSHSGMLK